MVHLRQAIFDHSYIGAPFRRNAVRRSGFLEDPPAAVGGVLVVMDDFRAISNALMDALASASTQTDFKDRFKASASQHLGWTFAEIDLHFELFATLWTVEERNVSSQALPAGNADKTFSRLLRFALFLCVQLAELRRSKRRSSLDSFNISAPFELDNTTATAAAATTSTGAKPQQTAEDVRVHFVTEARRAEKFHRLTFVQQRLADILALLVRMDRCVSEEEQDLVSLQVRDALGFLLVGDLDCVVGKSPARAAAELLAKLRSSDAEEALSGDCNTVTGQTSSELVLVLPPPSGVIEFTMPTQVIANHSATIFSLPPAQHTHVIGCFDCLVVVGPTAGVMTIEHCERVRVVGSCQRLRLVNCTECRVNVWTGARPIIADCRGITLGPYNARYAGAKQSCEAVCASIVSNNWRRPLSCDAGMGLDDADDGEDNEGGLCQIQSVEDFAWEPVYAVLPPNSSHGDAPALPSEYQNKLLERRALASDISQLLANAGLNAAGEDSAVLPAAVQHAFREWLLSNPALTDGLPLLSAGSSSSSSGRE